jgi:hypothetical protein
MMRDPKEPPLDMAVRGADRGQAFLPLGPNNLMPMMAVVAFYSRSDRKSHRRCEYHAGQQHKPVHLCLVPITSKFTKSRHEPSQ